MDASTLSRLLPHLATLLSAAVLGYVVMLNLDLLQSPPVPEVPTTAEPAPPAAIPQPDGTAELAELSGWHLFGEAQQPAANTAPATAQISAPQTRLQLSLHGVFTPPNRESEGWAIISAPGESEKGYRIGDELPGGAQLYAVEVRQVILTRSGQYESLPLPHISLSSGGAADSFEPPPLPGSQEPESYPEPQEQAPEMAPETGQTPPSPSPGMSGAPGMPGAAPGMPGAPGMEAQPDPATLEQLRSDPRYQGLIAPQAPSP